MKSNRVARVTFLLVGALSHIARVAAAVSTGAALSAQPPLRPPSAGLDPLVDMSETRLDFQSEPYLRSRERNEDFAPFAILPIEPRRFTHDLLVGQLSNPGDGGPAPTDTSAKTHDGRRTTAQRSHAELTKAMSEFSLTPIQRLSIRDYVGEAKAEAIEMRINDKEVLILKDPKTHEYIGEATISKGDDGSIVVTKLTGADFKLSKTLDVPVLDRQAEEADKVLSGSESTSSFNSKQAGLAKHEKEIPGKEISIPAVAIEGSAQYGPVSEATAVFRPDGSGYERGMRTNLASASAGAELGVSGKAEGEGFAGAKGGAGAQAFKVELFGNYFGKPEADEHGEFTRNVLGASGETHATLAEISGIAGCEEEKGCGFGGSIGFLGIGTGVAATYGAKVKLERSSAEGVPEEGVASSDEQVTEADAVPPAPVQPDVLVPLPKPSDESTSPNGQDPVQTDNDQDAIDDGERQDYEDAIQDGSVGALQNFLSKYPDSVYNSDVEELKDTAGQSDLPTPSEESKIY